MKDDFPRTLQDATRALDDFRARSDAMAQGLNRLPQDGLGALAKTLKETGDRSRDARAALRALGEGLLRDILGQAAKNISTGGFSLSSLLTGFRAGGGAVAPNGAYLVGERGPEILMTGATSGFVAPLNGGPAAAPVVSVTVINNARADVQTRESARPDGGRDITLIIDDLVAGVLLESGSRSARALRSRFGLSPVLTQR